MFWSLLITIFYNPLYNALIFIINHVPGGDVGIATIILTCLVKFVLFPLSKKSAKTQIEMKAMEPELAKIKAEFGSNREVFARKTMEFYKKNGLNPFAGFLLILIQLPIIIALASIFYRSGLPVINTTSLYSFINVPAMVNTIWTIPLGFTTYIIDIIKPNIVLSILAGLAQFVQIRLSVPPLPPALANGEKKGFSDDLARSMNTQMRYVMPIFLFLVSLSVSGAVALYWITGSVFMIGQEIYFRKTIKKGLVQ